MNKHSKSATHPLTHSPLLALPALEAVPLLVFRLPVADQGPLPSCMKR